jgi:glycosyltransferase involved in cell wall biosynthesis
MGIRRRLRTIVDGPEPRSPADDVSLLWADALAEPGAQEPAPPLDGPPSVAFVIPPPSAGSGGIATVVRLTRHFEERRSRCGLYLYGKRLDTVEDAQATLAADFAPVRATIEPLESGSLRGYHAAFATGWPSAYALRAATTGARRFYLVQDYEPLFYPSGSEAALAAATYEFGLHGITAGRWLAEVLRERHGMTAEPFDFGAEPDVYRLDNESPRTRVLFYARPSTPRRGFELGVMALELFHRERPDHELVLFGEDVSAYGLPFPFANAGRVAPRGLNELYNGAAACLVISLTNCSFLPLELIAAGCVPVVNDGENNRLVLHDDMGEVEWGDATPRGLADALARAVARPGPVRSAARPWDGGWEQVYDTVVRVASAG